MGQTRCTFKTRFTEHVKYPAISRVCDHLNVNSHDPDNVKFLIMFTSHDYKAINVRESVEILKLFKSLKPESVLNLCLGPCNGSLIKWMYPHNPFSTNINNNVQRQ